MKNIVIKWAVFLTAFLISLEVSAQNVRVSGVVTDALGPIPGANIMEEGTTNGTVTDVNGKYSISVSAKSTLVFSCIGYKEQKIRVGTKTVLNVDMVEESKMLDELVVVGYGVQRKSDVATSVASVKADEMKTFPAGNVADMLRGRAAGVNVTSSSGRPGSTPSITIRGSRSISADNAPLYIINGSPSSATEFSTLSADDIESVEILKDAASQAIYGARASDGVVLVTTKRGKAGKVEVSYNGYLGIQSLWRNFDFYSPEEYMQLRREAKAHDKGIVDAREISIAEALEDEVMQRVWASGKFIDWEKEMFRNAIYHNHDVSVRGGTEKIKVSAGANYFDQQGMVVTGSGYQKFSLRLNLDFEISKWISFGINSSYAMTKQDREDGNFNDFITSSPLAEIYDADGKYTKYINSEGNYNPLYRAEHYGREVTRDNYRLNFFMDVKPFKGFNYRLNTSVYNQTSEDGSYKDSQYPGGGGTAVLDESRTQNWLVENIVTYKVPIRNKKHQLTLTGVQSVDHNGSKSIGYSVENLPVDKEQFSMKVGDKLYTDKKEAGTALVEMCKEIKTVNAPAVIGEYAGFKMSVYFDAFNHKFVMNLKGQLSHNLEVGSDPLGNISRINHALESMPKQLMEAQTKLETVEHQLETAKVEVTKPFAQEAELAEKLERLSALNALLNMDEKGNDGIDMDDEPEAPKSEKEVADRPAKSIPLAEKTVGTGLDKGIRQYADAPAERVSLKAKLEVMKAKVAGEDTEKPMPLKAKGKEVIM